MYKTYIDVKFTIRDDGIYRTTISTRYIYTNDHIRDREEQCEIEELILPKDVLKKAVELWNLKT